MHSVGDVLTRQRFATVDKANNFTFEYEDGFDEDQLYPGEQNLT